MINLVLHPGGMLKRQNLDPGFRRNIPIYDQRIAELTGQSFGQDYKDRIAGNAPMILDSYITEQAILAMDKLNGRGLDMLRAIQNAHYQGGLDTSTLDVLAQLVEEMNIDVGTWKIEMQQAKEEINQVIAESHNMMQQWQIHGFPTFILEQEGRLSHLPHSQFYGDPNGWQQLLNKLVRSQLSTAPP